MRRSFSKKIRTRLFVWCDTEILLVLLFERFFIIGKTNEACKAGLDFLIQMLLDLGFSVKWEKVCGPANPITFLGMFMDSMHQRIELPQKIDSADKFSVQI